MTTWEEYHENHPEVLANWGEQNGRQCHCTCQACDPNGENRRRLDERFHCVNITPDPMLSQVVESL